MPSGNPLRDFTVVQTFIFLLLMQFAAGQSAVVKAPQPIVAAVGDDTFLPCHLEPAVDATSMTLEWSRPDLNPTLVHVWREGKDVPTGQNQSYIGRTSVSNDKLKQGDLSLKLSTVKLSDDGIYRCYIQKLNKESFITLNVGDTPPDIRVYKIILLVIAIIIVLAIACLTNGRVDLSCCIELIAECISD